MSWKGRSRNGKAGKGGERNFLCNSLSNTGTREGVGREECVCVVAYSSSSTRLPTVFFLACNSGNRMQVCFASQEKNDEPVSLFRNFARGVFDSRMAGWPDRQPRFSSMDRPADLS